MPSKYCWILTASNGWGRALPTSFFVVFQHEHPEIRLLPINMNPPVEKMYRHVLAGDAASRS